MVYKIGCLVLSLYCSIGWIIQQRENKFQKFYITGINNYYGKKSCNDCTLPPIEVYAHNRLEALGSIGATVWTEEDYKRNGNNLHFKENCVKQGYKEAN